MSFVGSSFFSSSSYTVKRFCIVFSLLFSFSCGVEFAALILLKVVLQGHAHFQVGQSLNAYLQKNQLSSGSFTLSPPPPDLDFIRLQQGDEQLLVSNGHHFEFDKLVNLPSNSSGKWIELSNPAKRGEWVIVSMVLKSGTQIQAGKNVQLQGIALYENFYRGVKWIVLSSLLLSILLACFFVYLHEIPLRKLKSYLEKTLLTKGVPESLPEGTLSPLYKLLEKIFAQNKSLISEMQSSLDNVAHDLRTPMTRLRAVAEYALQSHSDKPEIYRDALSDCLEESDRVLSTLKVMMSVAEAEAGTMRLDLQPVDIVAMVDDIIGLYQYVAEEAQVLLSCEGEKSLLVMADTTRLSQVWSNLLDNAIKYSNHSGKVKIYCRQKDGNAAVSFVDNGMGISKTEIGRIWDRLYRGDRSRSTQGLGLGLNYVKAVVEAHHGMVQVTSRLGEGSCFKVTLPLYSKITD